MDPQSPSRPEMVEAAKKFLMTPKVRQTPYEEQKEFLKGKGLTDAEIEEAYAAVPPLPPGATLDGSTPIMYAQPPSQQNRALAFAQSAVVIGSISYAGYRFLRSYVLPKFFDIPDPALEEVRQLQQQVNDLQNSMKFVMDSVSQTTRTLAMQQEEISKALISVTNRDTDLTRVEHGISTIKSLLLSHNQFAPIQAPVPVNALPSWQRSGPLSGSNASSGSTIKPANFEKVHSDGDDADPLDSSDSSEGPSVPAAEDTVSSLD